MIFPTLHVLRGVAALLVLLFHLTWQSKLLLLGGVFSFGARGVDLFFVLSGFVLIWRYEQDAGHPRRLGRYLFNRAARIYPTYWVVLGLHAIYLTWREASPPMVFTAADWGRAIVLAGNGPWPVPTSGTLSFELAAYASVGVLVACGWAGFLLLVAVWGLILVGGGPPWALAAMPGATRSPYLLLFFAGGLGAVVLRRWRPVVTGWHLLGALSLVGWVAYYENIRIIASQYQQAPMAIACTILVVVAAAYDQRVRRVYRAPLRVLGDASYAIYLTHWYALWELHRYETAYGEVSDVLRLGWAGVVVMGGIGIWWLVDRRTERWRHRLDQLHITRVDTAHAGGEREAATLLWGGAESGATW